MNKIEATNVLKEFIETYINSHGEEDVITVQLDNVDVEAFSTIVKELEKETVSRESYEHEYLLRKEFDFKAWKLERQLDKIRAEIEDLTYYCCEVHPRTVIDDVLDIIDKYKAGE